jgi:hypothetical protein
VEAKPVALRLRTLPVGAGRVFQFNAPVGRGGFMSSNDSKLATIQTRFQALTSVASSLNTATDELTKTVGVVDEALKRFNLGLVVWVIERKGDTVRIHDDATCIGWVEGVEGFRDGFTMHDELLS